MTLFLRNDYAPILPPIHLFNKRSDQLIYLFILLGVFLFDQFLKTVCADLGFIYLNHYGSFSLAFSQTAIVFSALITLLILFGFFTVERNQLRLFSLSLILGGGLSNFIDRIIYSGVRDIPLASSFSFNFADLFVISGIILLLSQSIVHMLNLNTNQP